MKIVDKTAFSSVGYKAYNLSGDINDVLNALASTYTQSPATMRVDLSKFTVDEDGDVTDVTSPAGSVEFVVLGATFFGGAGSAMVMQCAAMRDAALPGSAMTYALDDDPDTVLTDNYGIKQTGFFTLAYDFANGCGEVRCYENDEAKIDLASTQNDNPIFGVVDRPKIPSACRPKLNQRP